MASIPGLNFCEIPLHPSTAFCKASRLPFSTGPSLRNSQKLVSGPRAASSSDEGESASATAAEKSPKDAEFEERFTRWRVGKGKKAELRRLRKAGMDPAKVKSRQKGIFLPPVPLQDATSQGLKVELGFNPYSERLHGGIAALGLAALILVELGSGQSLIKYHPAGTLLLQSYFIFAVSAGFLKYQKEKISIWPKSKG